MQLSLLGVLDKDPDLWILSNSVVEKISSLGCEAQIPESASQAPSP